jgi:HK97 gp10 family phage protein
VAPKSYDQYISGIFADFNAKHGSVYGVRRARRKIAALPSEARIAMTAALETSAAELVALQKRLAPERTGALKDSIGWTTKVSGVPAYAAFQKSGMARAKAEGGMVAIVFAGNTNVRYAHLVEFGAPPHEAGGMFEGAHHPGAPAQPFFFPAYRALKKQIKKNMRKAVRQSIKNTLKRG